MEKCVLKFKNWVQPTSTKNLHFPFRIADSIDRRRSIVSIYKQNKIKNMRVLYEEEEKYKKPILSFLDTHLVL